jgi:phosphoribosylanthranilate isomerase
MRTAADLDKATVYSLHADALLFDAYHPQQLGGTGQTLHWEMLRNFCPSYSWFLAGGITPDNVLEALSQVNPNGIDLSSGVERSPGDKDLHKVAKLFERLRVQS